MDGELERLLHGIRRDLVRVTDRIHETQMDGCVEISEAVMLLLEAVCAVANRLPDESRGTEVNPPAECERTAVTTGKDA